MAPAKTAAKRPRRTTKRPAPPPMTVEAATQRELDAIATRDPSLATSAIAASALALARELDTRDNSATSKSMCARELRETMTKLRELAPPTEEEDGIDELADRRAARREKAAKPKPAAKPRRRAAT